MIEAFGSPDVGDKVAEERYGNRGLVGQKVLVAGLNGETAGPRFVDSYACLGTERPAFRAAIAVVQDNERPVAGARHRDP